jgi:hypothetical protein
MDQINVPWDGVQCKKNAWTGSTSPTPTSIASKALHGWHYWRMVSNSEAYCPWGRSYRYGAILIHSCRIPTSFMESRTPIGSVGPGIRPLVAPHEEMVFPGSGYERWLLATIWRSGRNRDCHQQPDFILRSPFCLSGRAPPSRGHQEPDKAHS